MPDSNVTRGTWEMPRYRSHKIVWALKIASMSFSPTEVDADGRVVHGAAKIVPEEAGYLPFTVDGAYVQKHNPQAGGYYVVYPDGYKSWSPAEAFEEGYTAVS